MSAAPQGFYADLSGLHGLQELESLDDIRNYQEILRRLHYRPHSTWCGCGPASVRKELSVFRLPGSEMLSLRCVDRAEHPFGECIFARSEVFADDSGTISDNIFRPTRGQPRGTTSCAHARAGEDSIDHVSFSRFVSGVLSEAFAESAAVSHPLAVATATTQVFVQTLQRALMRSRFTGDANAVEAAARHGTRVVLGIVESTLALDLENFAPLTLRVWVNDILVTETLLIHGTVWREAVGEALVWGKLMRPPFVGVAVVDGRGLIVRMRVFAVFSDGAVLAPVESEFERGYARVLAAGGGMFLKPLLRRDVADFLCRAGIQCPASFPFRPDFVVVFRSAVECRVLIVEVRGTSLGENAEYDRRLQDKRAYVEKLGPPFAYLEPRGWDFSGGESHIEWPAACTDWMPPSQAVDEWLRRKSV